MSQLRLKQVALVTTDLDTVLDDLAAVFGLRVAFRDPMVARFGLRNAVLPVGAQFLEVIEPVQAGTAAGRYLERRGGPGGYMVITHTGDQSVYRRRLTGLGVRVAFEFEADGFRCLQLHPSDTGGAFFEIDEQDGADRPGDPRARRRPDRVHRAHRRTGRWAERRARPRSRPGAGAVGGHCPGSAGRRRRGHDLRDPVRVAARPAEGAQ